MKQRLFLLITGVSLVSFLVGCAQAEEVVVQEVTKIPPTATVVPTQVPYNVTISVKGTEGQAIVGGVILIGSQEQQLDNSGQVVMSDLPDGSLNFSVVLPGYFPFEQTTEIQPGSNQVEVILEKDPHGLLVENACGPGETLLYIADFQDGNGKGWDLIELGMPGWTIVPNPDQSDDLVIAATEGAGFANLSDPGLQNLENAVWRFRYRYDGVGNSHINWRFAPDGGDKRYIVALESGNARLDRLLGSHVTVGEAGSPAGDQWHLMEISYYDGTVAVYIDGQEGITWTDPNPWQGGAVALEPYPAAGATFYYDDMSLCKLNAPFTPLPRPETGINLSLTVADQDGNPLPQVQGVIPEMGIYASTTTQVSDDAGLMVWTDIPGDYVTVQLYAPGYNSLEEVVDLQTGENTHSSTMNKDPNGLSMEQACLSVESVLYIDDFQDGLAQGWQVIDLGVPSWTVIPNPDNPDDLVIGATEGAQFISLDGLPPEGLNNAIWRFWFRYDGPGDSHINWRFTNKGGDTRYILALRANEAQLDRLADGSHITIRNAGYPGGKEWHLLELGYFNGEVFVFLDGEQMVVWQEKAPWEGGTVSLEPYPRSGSVFYYNNMSICELSDPPQSITSLEIKE